MQKIYYNGTIITLENPLYAEAILIEDGKIKKVGKKEEVFSLANKNTELIDLDGKCLMPSFIDAHSHIVSFSQTLGLTQLDDAKDFNDIVNKLKEYKEKNNIKKGEWIFGFGYDHNTLKEKTHPTKEILDKVSTENPILISHKSGHMGVTNTQGLTILKIDKNTQNPEGGLIGREKGNTEPNGYLEETAFTNSTKETNTQSLENSLNMLKKAQDIYLSYGITTIQDGLVKEQEFNLLTTAAKEHILKADIIGYVDLKNNKDIMDKNYDKYSKYNNHFRIGGYKIFLDGSPQGKTAWLTEPYEGEKKYKGYPIYKDKEVKEFVKTALKEKKQLLTHCNGDAAADQLIKTYEELNKEDNLRPVMIHAQAIRQNQIPRMRRIGMIPSYFVAHTYYWGDTHIKNLGKRAEKISPVRSTIDDGVKFTLHQDTPVILPNMIETIWTAVKRETKDGKILGEREQVSTLDAIEGITINAAYQYNEEETKGSLKEGKLADMVILSKDPLQIRKPDEIKNIEVLETIKEGEILYNKHTK